MTSTQRFIEDAIKGGWVNHYLNPKSPAEMMYLLAKHKYQMFLDPDAWRAVGKVRGWKDEAIFVAPYAIPDQKRVITVNGPEWQCNMIRMVYELSNGQTIEKYLKSIE